MMKKGEERGELGDPPEGPASLPIDFGHMMSGRDTDERGELKPEKMEAYRNHVAEYIEMLKAQFQQQEKEKKQHARSRLAAGSNSESEEEPPKKTRKEREEERFKGETLVHVFSVKKDRQSIRDLDLLLRNCKRQDALQVLGVRATGLAFQPAYIMCPEKRSSLWRPLLEFLDVDPIFKNRHVSADYGELPLSFAASAGNLRAMELMYKAVKNAKNPNECVEEELEQQRKARLLDFLQEHDGQGNTALHIAVKYNDQRVVDWFAKKSRELKDWSCFKRLNFELITPLTLAVQLGHMQLFQHMLEEARFKKYTWKFGPCSHFKVDLDQIDSWQESIPVGRVPDDAEEKTVWLFPLDVERVVEPILKDLRAAAGGKLKDATKIMWAPKLFGRINHRLRLEERLGRHVARKWIKPQPMGAIEVAVKHEVVGSSESKLFEHIVDDKWARHMRNTYLIVGVAPYVFYLTMITLYCVERAAAHRDALAAGQSADSVAELGSASETLNELIFLGVFSVLLVIRGVMHLRLDYTDLDVNSDHRVKWTEVESFLFKNMVSAMSISLVLLMWITWILRAAGAGGWELNLVAVLGMMAWLHGSTYLLPFRFFGLLIMSVHRMVVIDLLKFLIIFGFALFGFALGVHLLLHNEDPAELALALDADCDGCGSDWGAVILRYLWGSLGEVDLSDVMSQARTPWLALTLHIVFIIIASVLMLNLLVALLSRTFAVTEQIGDERWWVDFAATVLRYEDVWTKYVLPTVYSISPYSAAVWSIRLRTGKPPLRKCLMHKYRMPYSYAKLQTHGEEQDAAPTMS